MTTTSRQKAIATVAVGHRVSFSKTIRDEDIRKFAEASGDFNPLHLDPDYARRTLFGERIAHGILAVGMVSAALTRLPGVVVYVSQTSKFTRPVKIGDTIEAVAEVIEKTEEKSELRLKTTASNQRGEQVLDGEARVRLFDLKPETPA